MPRFVCSPVPTTVLRPLAGEEWFHISVELPPDLTKKKAGDTPGYISTERGETLIAKEFAKRLGAEKESDKIALVIRQSSEQKLHRFELPVVVNYAPSSFGKEFVQIGTADLGDCFELSLLKSSIPAKPNLLYMTILDECDLECVVSNLP